MDQFDIIGVLEAYAISRGWPFVYGYNDFEKNIATVQEFNPGQIIMIADFRATPTIINGKVSEIDYNCLIMLGTKIDADGQRAELDETPIQKYDRRIKLLMQEMATAIGTVACDNELTVEPGEWIVEPNMFDENIDFCTATNVNFIQ
jgi:hypothetical protein